MIDSEALPRLIDATPQTKLGTGSVGEVWRAATLSDPHPVAIKYINQPFSDAQRRSIETEIQVLADLSHPAIPKLYDFDLDSNRPRIVMEYIEGEPFHRIIADGALWQIPMQHRLSILAEIAAAATHLHDHGLIHRDIKPANIIGIDNPHLIDFGITAAIGAEVSAAGTPFYMLPHDQPPSIAHDRFGFALTAYEFLFGVHAIFTVQDGARSRDELRDIMLERLRDQAWRMPSRVPAYELPYDLRGIDLARLDAIFQHALDWNVASPISLKELVEALSSAILTSENQPFLDKMPEIAVTWVSGASDADSPGQQTAQLEEIEPAPSQRIVIGAVILTGIAITLFVLLQNPFR